MFYLVQAKKEFTIQVENEIHTLAVYSPYLESKYDVNIFLEFYCEVEMCKSQSRLVFGSGFLSKTRPAVIARNIMKEGFGFTLNLRVE